MMDYERLLEVLCVIALVNFYLKSKSLQSKLENAELKIKNFSSVIRDLTLNPITLEVGASYLNRMGTVHTIHYIDSGNRNIYRSGASRYWYQGGFDNYDKTVSPYDLVERVGGGE